MGTLQLLQLGASEMCEILIVKSADLVVNFSVCYFCDLICEMKKLGDLEFPQECALCFNVSPLSQRFLKGYISCFVCL